MYFERLISRPMSHPLRAENFAAGRRSIKIMSHGTFSVSLSPLSANQVLHIPLAYPHVLEAGFPDNLSIRLDDKIVSLAAYTHNTARFRMLAAGGDRANSTAITETFYRSPSSIHDCTSGSPMSIPNCHPGFRTAQRVIAEASVDLWEKMGFRLTNCLSPLERDERRRF